MNHKDATQAAHYLSKAQRRIVLMIADGWRETPVNLHVLKKGDYTYRTNEKPLYKLWAQGLTNNDGLTEEGRAVARVLQQQEERT